MMALENGVSGLRGLGTAGGGGGGLGPLGALGGLLPSRGGLSMGAAGPAPGPGPGPAPPDLDPGTRCDGCASALLAAYCHHCAAPLCRDCAIAHRARGAAPQHLVSALQDGLGGAAALAEGLREGLGGGLPRGGLGLGLGGGLGGSLNALASLRFDEPPAFDAVASMMASGARASPPSPAPPSPAGSPPPADPTPACSAHPRHPLLFHCGECRAPACTECLGAGGAHDGHRGVAGRGGSLRERLARAQGEAQAQLRGAAAGLEAAESAASALAERATVVHDEVGVVFDHLHTLLLERRTLLLRELEVVVALKEKALREHADALRRAASALRAAAVAAAGAAGTAPDGPPDPAAAARALVVLERALADFRAVAPVPDQPADDACLAFVRPDTATLKALGSAGELRASCTPKRSHVVNAGATRTHSAFVNYPCDVRYRLVNFLDRATDDGRESVKAAVVAPGDEPADVLVENGPCGSSPGEAGPGEGRAIFRPVREGMHRLHVRVHGCDIVGSPVHVAVASTRHYASLDTPVLVFGREGTGDGELCRPWGVACTSRGHLVIADRSNNRIQVFDNKGNFVFNFGEQGAGPGQFDRPAGVTVDRHERIVVADKDNHRVQVFLSTGRFVLTFGERGHAPGQFQYPWDVATDADCRIAVSDTRNHRVQLFSPDGVYLARFGWDGAPPNSWKSFDSPRGLAFTARGDIIVTDFNNHRAVLLMVRRSTSGGVEISRGHNINGDTTRGTELHRPQGVAVDQDGNILIADSRHNRISVFNSKGGYVTHFGRPGSEPGEMDRPSGICVMPDGLVAIVDFGNTRIQLF